MNIDFDPAKNRKNIAERGLSFDRVADLTLARLFLKTFPVQ